METKKWFERKFDFDFGADHYAAIYAQLKQAPDQLRAAVAGLAEDVLVHQPNGGWSIKEHTGHLSIMEPIWRTRFHDIQDKKPVLSPADLSNRATTEANFNAKGISVLLDQFLTERMTTLALLDTLNMLDGSRTSLHPRLQQPMRMIDLAYFVAEHDEHHILRIREIAGL
jgi:uncharacterized damage-inducible protein DinB